MDSLTKDNKVAIKKRKAQKRARIFYFTVFYVLLTSVGLLTWQWLAPLVKTRCELHPQWFCAFADVPSNFSSGYWGLPALLLTSFVVIIGVCIPILIVIALSRIKRLEHYWVTFKSAPSFARINTAYEKGTIEQLTITLSNGEIYTSKPQDEGTFLQMCDWPITVHTPSHRRLELVIPHLTATDFASIPRFLHTLINPLTNNIYAAVLHDYLYRAPSDPVAAQITKAEADGLLFTGMRACGVSKLTAAMIYIAVVVGGKSSFKRFR
jgi:hypothetical protein